MIFLKYPFCCAELSSNLRLYFQVSCSLAAVSLWFVPGLGREAEIYCFFSIYPFCYHIKK